MEEPSGPVASILHERVIRELADSRAFARGQAYFREGRVTELTRKQGSIAASVRGEQAYAVRIWRHADSLAYACSCPQGEEQKFCKHAVALALASVGQATEIEAVPSRAPAPSGAEVDIALEDALLSMPRSKLVAVLRDAAREHPSLRARILGIR